MKFMLKMLANEVYELNMFHYVSLVFIALKLQRPGDHGGAVPITCFHAHHLADGMPPWRPSGAKPRRPKKMVLSHFAIEIVVVNNG